MTTTDAEEWAWNYVASDIWDRLGNREEDLRTIAQAAFGHDIGMPDVDRIYLTEKGAQRPAVCIERIDAGYELVIEWMGEERHRSPVDDEFEDEVERFL